MLDQSWHRSYDPQLGRYLQADSLGIEAGQNLYAYVDGRPLEAVDPDGRIAFVIPAAVGLGEAFAWATTTAAGAAIGWLGGKWILNKSEPKPKNCPSGTLPIDQAKRKRNWSKDDVHAIKEGIGKRPPDWVGIAPNGDVIAGGPDGEAVNHGPAEDYLP